MQIDLIKKMSIKTYIDNVLIRGLEATDEEYVKKQMGDLLKSKNFNDLLANTDIFRKKLLKLDCFSKVEALIDVSDSSEITIIEF